MDFTDASFYDILASRGLEVKHAARRLEVVPTPQDIASELKISPFEPAIFISSCGRMESKVPVEYTESLLSGGKQQFFN